MTLNFKHQTMWLAVPYSRAAPSYAVIPSCYSLLLACSPQSLHPCKPDVRQLQRNISCCRRKHFFYLCAAVSVAPFFVPQLSRRYWTFPWFIFLFLNSLEAACSLNPLLTCSHEGQQIPREVLNPHLLWSCGDICGQVQKLWWFYGKLCTFYVTSIPYFN